MKKVDPLIDGRPEVYTEQSYLDIFPKEKIVYLSPDSRYLSQQAHAPPPAVGRWRRQRALASVGAAPCLKIAFFFQVNSWVAI